MSLNYKLVDSGFGLGMESSFAQVVDKDKDVFDKTPSGKKNLPFLWKSSQNVA